jgi:hypothetical protein
VSKQSEYITEAIFQAAVTLQWQAIDATEVGNGYPIGEGGDDHTDAIAALPWLVEAVTSFVRTNWRDLHMMEAGQAGHDFILTANGHGAGFWDRGLGARGDRLTDNCKPYGEFDCEFALDEDGDVVYLAAINSELIFGEYPETEDGE